MIEALRVAIHAAINKNPAGLKGEAIAKRMHLDPSVIYRWGELSGKPIPVERLVQFSLITEDSRPIAALCREIGGAFIPMPQVVQGASDKDLVKSIKEFSELAQAVAAAKADGELTEFELTKIRREASECQRAIARLLAGLESEVEA